MKTGVDNDGRIIARKCEVWWNGGAYADIGPRVTQKSGFTAAGPYDIENVAIDSYAVYTNLPPAGAFRGFGIPQLVWAYESHADIIARELKHRSGRVPLQERAARRPPARDRHGHARTPRSSSARSVAEQIGWDQPFDRGTGTIRRGRGIAVGSRRRSRRRRRSRSSTSPPTAAARSIAAPSTWAKARIRRWRRSSAKCSGIPAESIRVVHSRYRRDALRHGDARFALDLSTWATPCGSPPRTRATSSPRCAASSACRKAATRRSASCSVSKYGMQAGNIIGTGTYKPDYITPDMRRADHRT